MKQYKFELWHLIVLGLLVFILYKNNGTLMGIVSIGQPIPLKIQSVENIEFSPDFFSGTGYMFLYLNGDMTTLGRYSTQTGLSRFSQVSTPLPFSIMASSYKKINSSTGIITLYYDNGNTINLYPPRIGTSSSSGTNLIYFSIDGWSYYDSGLTRLARAAPALPCSESWSCTDWSACANNQQTRTCTDANNCGTTTTNPAITQSCSCTPNWQCSSWSDTTNECGTRLCTDANLCGVDTNKPTTSQACACVPSWQCSQWNACVNSQQTRTCDDPIGCNTNQPPLSQTCTGGCITDAVLNEKIILWIYFQLTNSQLLDYITQWSEC